MRPNLLSIRNSCVNQSLGQTTFQHADLSALLAHTVSLGLPRKTRALSPCSMSDPDQETAILRQKVEECLAGIARGEESALRALYSLMGGRIYGYLYSLLHNETDSVEVQQEVFTEIWEKADRFSSHRGSGISWFFAIARNRGIDRIRKRGRNRENLDRFRDERSDPDVDPSTENAPDDETLRKEDRERLEECLDRLAPESRIVIQLAFFSGLPHREIGEKLGQPLGTVKARIRRGLLSLRNSLQKEGGLHE